MKRLLSVIVVAGLLAGCQTMKENPALGIGLGVAAGAVAASIATHHDKKGDDKDHHRSDEYRNDQSRGHKRNHHNLPTCDFSYGNPNYKCVQGDGEIYRP